MAESITRKNIDLDILDYYDGKIKEYVNDKVGTGGLTIDDTLSDTSTNPVQNKVVKQAIDEKADKTTATTDTDGLMSAEDKTKLDDADNTYALKSKYGDTTIDVGRKDGSDVGERSTAEGYNNVASGDYAHAEGTGTKAIGNRSHAEGAATNALGNNAHSEGHFTTAFGECSHSEGDSIYHISSSIPDYIDTLPSMTDAEIISAWNNVHFSLAKGLYSHVEGNDSLALGNESHAEGSKTIAKGVCSHSGGSNSLAEGANSFAHGYLSKATNSCETSFGKCNKSSSDTLFSVGDGTSDSARHNAFEITTTGGKLHDKDIATTDLIPTELPANGGNADTLNGKSISQIMAVKSWFEGDLNDLKEQGSYISVSSTNNPTNVWGTVIVAEGGTGSVIQIYIPTFESGETNLWFRHFNGSNWSTWRNSADGGNAKTLNNLDAYHMGTVTTQGNYYPPSEYPIYCQYNVHGDNRFKFMVDTNCNPGASYEVRCDYATNAEAVGGYTANLLLKNVANGNILTTTINECFVTGTYAIESSFTPDFPSGYGTYGFLDVRAYGSICYQTVRFENGNIINRAAIVGQTSWTEWSEIYASGNKPYVTGSVTVAANTSYCATNHGFMPSGAIWWCAYSKGVGVLLGESGFDMGFGYDKAMTVNYLIFK